MKIGIIGSGPTGIAAAKTALDRGYSVEILDFGSTLDPRGEHLAVRLRSALSRGQDPSPEDLVELGVHAPLDPGSLIGLLPFTNLKPKNTKKTIMGSNFPYVGVDLEMPVTGASPPRSLAKGGLSNVWGTACYRLQAGDYVDWPLEEDDFTAHYESAAEILRFPGGETPRAGIYPPDPKTEDPLQGVDWNAGGPVSGLIKLWRKNEDTLDRLGMRGGQSSLAVVPPDTANDQSCHRCGYCFYGCPFDAMFQAGSLIDEWIDHPLFSYRSGLFVEAFREEAGKVEVFLRRDNSGVEKETFDRLILAANTLSSLRIVSDSMARYEFAAPLLDNDMFVVPMFADVAIPKGWKSEFALSEGVVAIAQGFVSERPVHIQFYSFNDYFLGALARHLPSKVRNSILLNRMVMAFIYLHGDESRSATATPTSERSGKTRIEIDYSERNGSIILDRVLTHLRKHSKLTGLKPIRAMKKSMSFGFSGHLAGTLPMRKPGGGIPISDGNPHTDPNGRLAGATGVFVADASNFPSLPAQNPTFTAMANAARIVSKL